MKLCVVTVCAFLFLSGCTKSEDQYLQAAKAKIAANDIPGAELELKTGLEKHPNSDFLKLKLAEVYTKTGNFRELESFIELNDFLMRDMFYSQLAHHEFSEQHWQRAHDFFVRSADYATDANPKKCDAVAMENYRNALAARLNQGGKSDNSHVIERMQMIMSGCSTQPQQDRIEVERIAKEVGLQQ